MDARLDRRLCVVLAYSLMTLCTRDRDRFDVIASTIFDSVPDAPPLKHGRALLRDLLIVKGGRAVEGRS